MTLFGRIRITWEHVRVCWGPLDLCCMDCPWPFAIGRRRYAGTRYYVIEWSGFQLYLWPQWWKRGPHLAARSAAKETG